MKNTPIKCLIRHQCPRWRDDSLYMKQQSSPRRAYQRRFPDFSAACLANLVNFEKMDDTQFGSINVAIDKAVSSALFRRPTRAFQDGVASGGAGLLILQLCGASPVEGGIPIIDDGKVVGAIGISGGTLAQDALCAAAGVLALKQSVRLPCCIVN